MNFSRRDFINSASVCAGMVVAPSITFANTINKKNGNKEYAAAFDAVWSRLDAKYCYFAQKGIDWQLARKTYRPLAIKSANNLAFKQIINEMLWGLFDGHTYVRGLPIGLPRMPYFDLRVANIDNVCKVIGTYKGAAANINGIQVGDEILEINGVSIKKAARNYYSKLITGYNQEAWDMALNIAVSGKIGEIRKLKVRHNSQINEIILPLTTTPSVSDISSKIIGDNVGYIAINSFGYQETVAAFGNIMRKFKDTKGIIIDVRYNGGGDTAYARPMMGWFTETKKPYALMNERKGHEMGEKWTEFVEPNGDFTYKKPVAILTGYWSASMAEGFPMGMKAVCGAKIIGNPTMGLGAAVEGDYIEAVDLNYQYSFQPVYDINGTPREQLLPDIIVKDDEALSAALKYIA